MRKRSAGHTVYASDNSQDDGEDFNIRDQQGHPSRQRSPRRRKGGNNNSKRQQALVYRQYGSMCFVVGVMGFCLLQGLTFFVIDQMGDGAERDDDDNMMADDDSLGFLPSPIRRIFSMISDFASERSPFHIFGPSFHEHDQQPILIIGGSDGSGTRAFVDTIRELGAVIVADDRETFDVHAQMLFHHKGWPGLVHAVLNYTHTADYEWDDLIRLTSQEHVDKIETETKYLMKHLKMKYDLNKRPLRRAYLERLEAEGKYQPIKSLSQNRHKGKKVFSGVARPTTFPAIAKGISFAMKAPVSMLVLPVFCRLFRSSNGKPIKFLHVIRE